MTETLVEGGVMDGEVAIPVDHQNRLQVATDNIGGNELWNHANSVEVQYDDLLQIPTPDDTSSYTAIGHADMVETLYKHADRLMAPKDFYLDGQKYIVSKEGNRMFFVHSYRNGDTGMQLALAGRNSLDKSMTAALSVGSKVIVCDNLAMITEDGITIMRRHSGNARNYLNDQIILGMVKATESWDNMRWDRDHFVDTPVDEERGYELMGLAKALTAKDKASSKRLLSGRNEWKSVQKYWADQKHEYEGGNRTLWAWYNSFTVDMKSLKPELQLPQHASLHKVAKKVSVGHHAKRSIEGNGTDDNAERFGEVIERLTEN